MTFKSGDALSPLSAPLVDRDLTDTQCIPRRWPESEQLQFSLSSPVRSFLPSAKVPGAVSVLRRKYDNINGNDTCNYKTFGDTARPLRRCDFAF